MYKTGRERRSNAKKIADARRERRVFIREMKRETVKTSERGVVLEI